MHIQCEDELSANWLLEETDLPGGDLGRTPKRGVSKPTVHNLPNCPSIFINQVLREKTTVPNKKAYFYTREIEENDKPLVY